MTSPKPISRSPESQAQINQELKKMSLYQFEACPFCVKVRRATKRMALPIQLRDVKLNEQYKNELVQQGGDLQVPCLRIEKDDGSVQWMYESSDIIQYLEQKFMAK